MRSTIRVFQKTYAFLFRFNASALLSYRENHSTGLIPVPVCAVVSRKMCDDQHEQVEQTETTDVQKKTLSKAFVLHFPLFRNKRIQGTQ